MNRIDGSVIQRWVTLILLIAGIPLTLNILRIDNDGSAIATSTTPTEQPTPTTEPTIKVEIQEPVKAPAEQLEPFSKPAIQASPESVQPVAENTPNCTWSPNFRDKNDPTITRPPEGAMIKYNAWEPSGHCHVPLYEYWNSSDDFKYNTGTDAEIVVIEPQSN